MVDRVGQQLGNYRLVWLLGQGGFAQVYLGEHLHLETQAAIKVLTVQIGAPDLESFRKEARTIAHLEHPHIVRVLEFGVEGTTPFLVMTYAVNGTLRQRYPKGTRVPQEDVVHYVRQVAEALQYAHTQRLIHRDVKPANMLLGSTGEVLLSDFGLAVVAQSEHSLISQEMAGTLPYMAPEQIQGTPRPASDQYALGIVAYEWLCGTHPFQGTGLSMLYHHLHTPAPALREQLPTIPPAVEAAVLKTLAKDPKARFASVQAFATALEQASHMSQVVPPRYPGAAIAPSQAPQPTEAPAWDQVEQRTEPILPSDQLLPTGGLFRANQPHIPSQRPYLTHVEDSASPIAVWTAPFLRLLGLLFLLTAGISLYAFNFINFSDHAVELGLSLLLLIISIVANILIRGIIPHIALFFMALGALLASLAFSLQALPGGGLQALTSNILQGVSPNLLFTTGLVLAAVISLLWIIRPFTSVNRIVLFTLFGMAVVCTLLQYLSADSDVSKHYFLLVALLTLIHGAVIAVQMEQRQRTNRSI